MPQPSRIPRLIRFGITGCAGFIVDFGLLVALHTAAGWPLIGATLAAYTVGGIVHYALTRLWVFPHPRTSDETAKVLRYLALGALNALATVIAVSTLTWAGLDYRAAKIITVIALFFTNYTLVPRFVMTWPGSRTDAPPSNAPSRNNR